MSKPVEVAVYYFPNYHVDKRNEAWHGKGWTEWELTKRAEPRFAGHDQPKVPLWGYEDEADPAVMSRKIDAAADHGVDTFIFDWYWYEDGPYLDRALEEGFLGADNNSRLKFALMWANHDWMDIHPAQRSTPYNILAQGTVSREAFTQATDHMIRTYFTRPNYWRVDGKLYFSVYELMSLVKGLGSIEATREALDDFRARVRAAGLGELHVNAVVWGVQILPGEQKITNGTELLAALGVDSISSYVWIHHQELPTFPETPYAEISAKSTEDWSKFSAMYGLPYLPNVTMGWDSSPRTVQSDGYENLGYPYMGMLSGNTPAQFELSLVRMKQFLSQELNGFPAFTVNAWNEWTEGSYLEPDTKNGMAYLEAIKRVFG
ncbi:glycoside hydrolase family 99-like domain-containing protein [Paenibacillus sp. CF384]|uniref:glycosyltransferase WbsX family protein n=1 Tax=Paenibacillus sp. CF384 TaxID=1884382 RepID=UPI00089935AE|nr:glycoside hydrolase family 99-like domain-containing protein [Paenibacillus sp. CF384]SDW95065.1 Glycosyltransferase WbsX [Paenibacillus sp. CF384]